MSESNEFNGLPMPVFTAFGWAGEETAIQFALSQLELFINNLHAKLPRSVRDILPFRGLSQVDRNVYLAAEKEPEKGLHIVFNARPMSLEMQIVLANKAALTQALQQISAQPTMAHRLITELGPEWTLHMQQMQYDPENETAANYQDLFKGGLAEFTDDTATAVFEKAAYLNGEEKWVTPMTISRRFESEKIATMRQDVIGVLSEYLTNLVPLLNFLTAQSGKKRASSRQAARTKRTTTRTTKTAAAPVVETAVASAEEGFDHVSLLKPLHLSRGFVNMLPKHWPFFSINSRTETRSVTVYYDGVYDKNCAVWRMLPNDQARLVVSPPVQEWLEAQFLPDDRIHVVVRKLANDEIQVSLKPAAQ